ncbi:uncharacterized protein [Amphiura filiformis]|uniref:uncharacterized protein n=1 Tax=Amphiura filiformis TaxID=82378 RepID=UPI003B217927
MTTKVFDLRSKRTQANAPRSLFGTMVEIKDPQALHEEEHLEPKRTPQKPDKLARFMPQDANQRLEEAEELLRKQEHKVRFQLGKMKDLENNALKFEPDQKFIKPDVPVDALTYVPTTAYSPYETDVKLNSKDISLAEQFNKLGLGSTRDYNGQSEYIVKKPGQFNYERYNTNPNNSKYRNAGNVLGVGGLFTYKGKEYAQVGKDLQPLGRVFSACSFKITKKSGVGIEIPANIRAIHGARLCAELMKDEDRVKRALHLVPSGKTGKKRTSPETSSPVIVHSVDPMYSALGNALRSDVFNGISYGHIKSLNTASYTEDIPAKSTEIFPPKFGVQRNADSKWNEDNVIRQRMKKQWDEVTASKAKQDN